MSTARKRYLWVWPALVGSAFVVLLVAHEALASVGFFEVGLAILATLIAALGSAISAHQPGNRIAWLLRVTAVVIVLLAATSLAVESDQPLFSLDLWNYLAVVIFTTLVEVALYPVLLILFIFPNGQYLTRRWAWAGWLAGVTTAAMLLVAAFSEEVGKVWDPNNEYWNLSNPIGFLPSGFDEFVVAQAVTVMMILGVGGVVAMIVRYRRSDLVVRKQIKWVTYAAGIAAVALFLTTLSSNEVMWNIMPMIALAVIPVAITIAITKYKLFEIDRLLSRSLTYALVVGLLAAAFFGLITLITTLLPTQDNSLAVAGSTLAVAALFNPLRKRVQHAVDRRFNRSGYRAEQVSEEFAAKLRESLTTEELVEAWSQTVNESFQPELTGIWLNKNLTTTPKRP